MSHIDNKNLFFDLSHFGLIAVSGEDAETFLQNQITADLADLDQYGWLQAAWCIPNGRVLSNFILYRKYDGFHFILPSMLKDKVMQRLKMFVLRSKVEIKDASDNFAVIGLYGENTMTTLEQVDSSIKAKGERLQQGQDTTVIHIDDSPSRVMMVASMENVKLFLNRIQLGFQESDRSTWSLLDIESGLPWIIPSTSEGFLPQMLNLDINHGLSFKKGCYPGQEVIARLHYRGELKKRLFIGTGESNTLPGPGDQLEDKESGKLIGDILDAEPTIENQFKLLAVCELKEENDYTAILRGSHEIKISLSAIE